MININMYPMLSPPLHCDCFDKNHPWYQWPLVCAKCNLCPDKIVTNVLRLEYFMLSMFLWWAEVESILWLHLWRHWKDGSYHWSRCTFCRCLLLGMMDKSEQGSGWWRKKEQPQLCKNMSRHKRDNGQAGGRVGHFVILGGRVLTNCVLKFDSRQCGHTPYTRESRGLSFDP